VVEQAAVAQLAQQEQLILAAVGVGPLLLVDLAVLVSSS
jgi:hypothetical protein